MGADTLRIEQLYSRKGLALRAPGVCDPFVGESEAMSAAQSYILQLALANGVPFGHEVAG
jgi:hypothetical protein